MAEVLLVAGGIFHPPWWAWRHVQRLLSGLPDFEITHIRHLNYIDNLDLSRFAAMVLYYHHKQLDRGALSGFDRFVTAGGGVLALHSATASFTDNPRYFEILGGQFAGHGPVESFDIEPVASDDEIFGRIASFSVKDELYLHELQPDMKVHFAAQYGGQQQPMVWTRMVGSGRVCYVCPGHRTATIKQPPIQEILRQGLAWVVKGSQP